MSPNQTSITSRVMQSVSTRDVNGLCERRKRLALEWQRTRSVSPLIKDLADGTELKKLARIQVLVETISMLAKEQASNAEPSIVPLADSFNELLDKFGDEYGSLDLDEVIVGALAQVVCCPVDRAH